MGAGKKRDQARERKREKGNKEKREKVKKTVKMQI